MEDRAVAEPERRIEVRVDSAEASNEIATYLRDQGAAEIDQSEDVGIVPVIGLPFVIAALVGAAGLASIVVYLARTFGCMVVVDARADDIKVNRHCEIRGGRVILVAGEKTKIEVSEVSPLFDFTAIAKTAVEQGAEAAKTAAEAAGATAKVLAPDEPVPGID
jgi:hypothetical protein